MKENRGFLFNRIRLIALILSVVGLGVNTLRADSKIVIISPEIDVDAVCGFNIKDNIKLCVTDATDTCIWEVTDGVGSFGNPIKTYGNIYGDTILFKFSDEPKTGTITAKIVSKTDHTVVKGTAELKLTQIPKAAVVSDITWDAPVCQNIAVRFELPEDEGFATKYLPGQLHFAWTFLEQEQKDWSDYTQDYRDAEDEDGFSYTRALEDPAFDGGKVVVTPYTCDGPLGTKYRTNATDKPLVPFIVQGLYTDEAIKPLKQKEGEQADGEDRWEEDEVAEGERKKICHDYSDTKGAIWNRLNGDGSEGRVYLGFGDFQAWLDAEDPSTLPEYYYSYTWEFDEKEFVADVEKMERDAYAKMGFGLNKSRIILRVMGGKNDGFEDNIHTVKLTVRCDTCIARGGNPSDFTYTSTIQFDRKDSISDFRDPEFPIDYTVQAEGKVCAGEETTLRLSMDETSALMFETNSNAEYFILDPRKPNGQSAGWQETGSRKEGNDNIYNFKTAKTSWTGRVGDTINVSVYPANSCFRNLKETTQNGKMFKIFVRNPPIPPTLYDPVLNKAIAPQFTESRWEEWKQENKDAPDEQETSERVQVCNFTTTQSSAWLASTQTFGLQVKGDSLFAPPGGSNAFRIVDFDNMLDDENGRSRITRQLETRSSSSQKDSSWVSLSVRPDARQYFENVQEIKLGFYAFGACPGGDTGVYYIRIIDTLAVTDIVSDQHYMGWDTICEGLELDLHSNENYVTTWDVQGEDPYERTMVVTDRVDYDWKKPDDWSFISKSSSRSGRLNDNVVLNAGASSGTVQLRFQNRCGYSRYLDSNVFVYPFVRFQIIGDTTPCRGETVEYKFVKPEFRGLQGDSIHYTLGYPGTWSIVNGSIRGMTREDDTISMSFKVADLANRPVSMGGYYWNSDYDNPMPHLSPGVEAAGCVNVENGKISPHHVDSLTVKVKPYTSKPIAVDKYDTVCADEPYRFDVKKGADVDDSVFFSWFFPDGWTVDYFSKDWDTVDFMTPVGHSHERHTLRVVSNRYDCKATNKGDTLDIPILLMDTLQVKGDFYDAELSKRENKLV
ncbi:MAG: hypothetical protein K2L03_01575, partial [Bacteroidales bacterium]|nr:hypothetical protein [Bacteroidales bacterium]